MVSLERGWYLSRLARMLDRFAAVPLLRAGLQLGLFEKLREPHTVEQLADDLGLQRDLVGGWARSTYAQGFLRRQGDCYRTSEFVRWILDSKESASLQSLIDQVTDDWGPRLRDISGFMQGNARDAFGSTEESLRMAEVSRLIEDSALRVLGRVPGARRARRVLDIGCGYGTYLAGFLRRYRDAQGIGIERDPAVAEQARRQLDEAQVSRRGEIRIGDFASMEFPLGNFDLILLNNNLFYFPPDSHPALFRRIYDRLSPRGVLAVQTPVASANWTARTVGSAAWAAEFDLYLLTHGNLFGLPDVETLRRDLELAGFAETGDVAIFPGGVSRFIWARRGQVGEAVGNPERKAGSEAS